MLAFWKAKAEQTRFRPDQETPRDRIPRAVPLDQEQALAFVQQDFLHSDWLSGLTKGLSPVAFDLYVLPMGCVLLYIPNWIREDRELRDSLEALELNKDPNVPRETLGIGYTQMPGPIRAICDKLNRDTDLNLASAYLNKYRKEKVFDASGQWVSGAGKDSIAAHRDREMGLLDHQVIACVSLGQKRKFIVRYYGSESGSTKPKSKVQFRLGQGDLLIMGGNTNKYCTHEVPKEPALVCTDDRHSLTFRPARMTYNYYG